MASKNAETTLAFQTSQTDTQFNGERITRTISPEKEKTDSTEKDEQGCAPINDSDREQLTALANQLEQSNSLRTTLSQYQANMLENFDSKDLAFDDVAVDPSNPAFDVYKWARMILRLMGEKGIIRSRAGVTFKRLDIYGSGPLINLQKTVTSPLLWPLRLRESFGKRQKRQILHSLDGVVRSGELLIVFGRPGSGCSTLLKSVTGELHGLDVGSDAIVHYNGITQEQMLKHFRGEVIYTQEVDKHFPHLTVGQTLEFAAAARTSHTRVQDISRKEWVKHITKVMMAVFGLLHTYDTKVGNDYVRGVSGGERKRVSIAESALAGSPVVAWDNSTRGLDSATALKFVKSLRMAANLGKSCHLVAIYQASQAIYDEFDKAIVLYEGREIYFGPADLAKKYFENMGWLCPPRQTTGDFLTSVTNPQERRAREGIEVCVPQTPEDFQRYWRASPEHQSLQNEIVEYEKQYPIGGEVVLDEFERSRKAMQADHVPSGSSYTISLPMQVKMCTKRAYQRLWGDKTSTITTAFAQASMSLVIGSIFYGTTTTTDSLSQKGGVLFFAMLLNALIALIEINDLYNQRPIVQKHASYAFYRPWTEALAGVISNVPVKFVTAVAFNIVLYFLAGLREEPAQFFIFFLFSFLVTLTMSTIFRTVAALTRSLTQAMATAGVLVLALVMYTGYIIPRPDMHPWFKWISWINPLAYAFESLLLNEMHERKFTCSDIVPAYPGLSGDLFICATTGAVAGQTYVTGDAWLTSTFDYHYSHMWRNLCIVLAFMFFFLIVYLFATELGAINPSLGEVLVFRRDHVPRYLLGSLNKSKGDEESGGSNTIMAPEEKSQDEIDHLLERQTEIFSWKDVTYDIRTKNGDRRLLDGISGWVKPGKLTALMGVSGAGKTTLLDVLAERTSIGVVNGDFLISGKPRDPSFQRKTGYVQQQDLHLETSTVREALRFSAYLRQPKHVSKAEKFAHVENVIKVLDMEDFSEAVVGIPGEGLNVHQRKLLTIGVELAAKPRLLLFLDEPTSDLDSQSAWSIITVLRKLADSGQAVLSTIHQPSSTLFQEFDQLLFLGTGGKTVYFGEIGENSHTLLNYFERHDARPCSPDENPAEYMLEVCGEDVHKHVDNPQDWHEIWKNSNESKAVYTELESIAANMSSKLSENMSADEHTEFAMPLKEQIVETTIRVFQQYWRTPTYIWGKLSFGIAAPLFVGFSFFLTPNSIRGTQNAIFSIFMITTMFTALIQQVMPRFVIQRDLYEVRERPSKAYSWKAFLIANMIVEIPYQMLLGILVFAGFYFPIFGIQTPAAQGLVLLYCIQFFVYNSLYAQMCIAALPDASTAGAIATILFCMTLIFNGVFQGPYALPGFWIFMYRVSPMTYFVAGLAGTTLHDRLITCASNEIAVFQPPPNQTCGAYMSQYLAVAPGKLLNSAAMENCQYCPVSVADQYLTKANIEYGTRWRNYGILFAYIGFNVVGIIVLYYGFRIKRWRR